MTTPRLAAAIEAEEGREHEAYPDPLSLLGKACAHAGLRMNQYRDLPGWQRLSGAPWTVGVGQTGPGIVQGTVWTDVQIDAARDASIAKVERALDDQIPWWRKLNDARQDVLVQAGFQLGVTGLLAFHHTLAAIMDGEWEAAADGMLQSAWARQTPNRVKRLADLMKTGAYPA